MEDSLEKTISYEFKDRMLLKEALMHRSYAVENSIPYDNQRLEYLGDAVLEILISEYLFKKYPSDPEGVLTKLRASLVQQESLAALARKTGLDRHLIMGRGETESGGNKRNSTLSDAFESFIGAFYLDSGGLDEVRHFLLKLIEDTFPDPVELMHTLNPKGALQEYTQSIYGIPPVYSIVEVSGPDHKPVFKVNVSINEKILAEGSSSSRKSAESTAAKAALDNIKLQIEEETDV